MLYRRQILGRSYKHDVVLSSSRNLEAGRKLSRRFRSPGLWRPLFSKRRRWMTGVYPIPRVAVADVDVSRMCSALVLGAWQVCSHSDTVMYASCSRARDYAPQLFTPITVRNTVSDKNTFCLSSKHSLEIIT